MRGKHTNILSGALAALAFATFGLASICPASAQEISTPAPKVVIYPGDIITSDMLVDISADLPEVGGPFALSRADVVGKMARRTLLPGRSIPLKGVDAPRAIRNGAEVKLIYIDGGLEIVTTGAAMQDGGIGETVKIRNNDSGVTVSGQVQPDGTVRVNGG